MKKLFALLLIAIVAPTFAISEEKSPYKEITAEELVKMKAENPKLAIIDSRGGEYFDGVVIKGAKNLTPDQTTEEALLKIVATKNDPIVFYCTNENCPASAKSGHKASELGFTNLFKYKAGIEDWVKKGLETEKLPVPAAK